MEVFILRIKLFFVTTVFLFVSSCAYGLDSATSNWNNAPQNNVPVLDTSVQTQNNNQGWQQYNNTQTNNANRISIQTNYIPDITPASNDNSKTLTDEKINDYFNQILDAKTTGNPMGDIMLNLPRYGISFFRQSPNTQQTQMDQQRQPQIQQRIDRTINPLDNVPVTRNYRINIGDELSLTIWGIPEEGNYTFYIERDGMATIPHLGSIRLAGYTLFEAEKVIQARLNQYYTGYQMNLSMGRLSSIMIYITGNALQPGAYNVSSSATLVNALLVSGGPSANGSLRKIELRRDGRLVTVLDMYALLMRGDKSHDVPLQAGDVIYIPPVGDLVGLAGEIKNPGVFELNGATRVKDLLDIAKLSAYTSHGRIQFYRIYDNSYASAFEGSFNGVQDMVLQDGDILRLYPVYNMASSVTLSGPVPRPGNYIIVPGRTRVMDIIERAGGLANTAADTAEVTRVTPTVDGPVNERFIVNLREALAGNPEHNITLENTDHITIMIIPNWRRNIQVSIEGEVARPGTYSMLPGEKLSDLITRAGGFTERAFLRGAIFTRESVAAEQRIALNQMADTMERELLDSMQNTANTSAGATASTGMAAEYARRRDLIDKLRTIDIMGRVITKIDTPKNIIGTPWDYELEAGDRLRIPDKPLTINVMGAVYSASSQVFRPGLTVTSYINAAGGAVKNAHKRMVYLLKSDGSTIKLTRNTSMLSNKAWIAPKGFSAIVEPGDTIVVPVKYLDSTSRESFKDAVDIIYKVAVAIGVIVRM